MDGQSMTDRPGPPLWGEHPDLQPTGPRSDWCSETTRAVVVLQRTSNVTSSLATTSER